MPLVNKFSLFKISLISEEQFFQYHLIVKEIGSSMNNSGVRINSL